MRLCICLSPLRFCLLGFLKSDRDFAALYGFQISVRMANGQSSKVIDGLGKTGDGNPVFDAEDLLPEDTRKLAVFLDPSVIRGIIEIGKQLFDDLGDQIST